MSHLTWYVARACGIVAWGLVLASIGWGLVHATHTLRHRAAPWWVLGVHRWLGALAVTFTVLHVGAVMVDGYVPFGPAEVLVPFVAAWHPVAVAWGIAGTYLLLAVETTSLLRRHLSRRAWRTVHLGSYGLFALVTTHALTAGTDARSLLAPTAAVAFAMAAAAGAVAVLALRSDATVRETRPHDEPARDLGPPALR
jgi:hypothetical protein